MPTQTMPSGDSVSARTRSGCPAAASSGGQRDARDVEIGRGQAIEAARGADQRVAVAQMTRLKTELSESEFACAG